MQDGETEAVGGAAADASAPASAEHLAGQIGICAMMMMGRRRRRAKGEESRLLRSLAPACVARKLAVRVTSPGRREMSDGGRFTVGWWDGRRLLSTRLRRESSAFFHSFGAEGCRAAGGVTSRGN